MRVDVDFFEACAPFQSRFPRIFDAALTNELGTAIIAGLPFLFELREIGVGNPPDKSDNMRSRGALRVFAHPARAPFHTWILIGMGGKHGSPHAVQAIGRASCRERGCQYV